MNLFGGFIRIKQRTSHAEFECMAPRAKGDPLFVVMRTDVMRVCIAVPEADGDWVRKGVEGRMRVPALKGKEFTGLVERTSWSLSRTERTLLAEIDLSNADGELRPGMYIYATLSAERTGALTISASAVVTKSDQTQGDQTYCYLLEDGKAVKTPVKAGVRDARRVEILVKQTHEGGPWEAFIGDETVVTDPSKLTDAPAAPPAAK